MEALKMKIFLVAMLVAFMTMAVQNVSAQDGAPAPSPTSDAAAAFIPALFASVAAAAAVRLFL
ncbi:General amino acid permease [Orobanche gracilis]